MPATESLRALGQKPRESSCNWLFAPKWSGNANLTYEWDIGASLVGRFNIGAKYMSEYNTGSDLDPEKLQEAYTLLNARIGMPASLSQMGVDAAAIEKAAPLAEKDHTNGTNPRRAGADDYRRIMRAAL